MAAISLPNGCNSLPTELLPQLERFSTIYLWMDNDAAGIAAREKFARYWNHVIANVEAISDGDNNDMMMRMMVMNDEHDDDCLDDDDRHDDEHDDDDGDGDCDRC